MVEGFGKAVVVMAKLCAYRVSGMNASPEEWVCRLVSTVCSSVECRISSLQDVVVPAVHHCCWCRLVQSIRLSGHSGQATIRRHTRRAPHGHQNQRLKCHDRHFVVVQLCPSPTDSPPQRSLLPISSFPSSRLSGPLPFSRPLVHIRADKRSWKGWPTDSQIRGRTRCETTISRNRHSSS